MAAVDYFLKLQGIAGESHDEKHPDEIQLDSWSWGEAQSGTFSAGGGGGAGKVTFQDFHFVQQIHKGSPKLFLCCAKGDHIPKATLICRKAGGKQEEFYTVEFTDLLVSSFQQGGSGGSSILPTEQIALNFSKVEMKYKMQNKDGTLGGAINAHYDVKKQTGG